MLGVYQQAQRWPEREAAVRAWGELLGDAIAGRPAPDGKVVAIGKGRRTPS